LKPFRKYVQTNIDLNSTNRKFYLVAFSVFFAFVFLNFFEPFGLYYDKSISHEDVFIELFIAMLTAFVVLLLTQFVVRELFKVNRFTAVTLILWFLFEAIIVASVWFILEVLDKTFIGNYLALWLENFVAYVLIMFLPYFLYVGYLHAEDIVKRLETVKNSSIVSDGKVLISLKDENDDIKMILKVENLLFIQSSDNYVEINHLENDVAKKLLVRNSVKKMEEQFSHTMIIRCHRSFMVNTSKIEFAKKTPSGFNLRLKHLSGVTIPVSKSYISEFRKFSS
jgi:hypothetical protein